MNLKYENGDLIEMARQGHFDIIVQGCNCFCAMNSGIARQIRDQLPDAWEEDRKTVAGDIFKLGSFTTAFTDKFLVVNAYTQYGTSKHGEDVFEYASFEVILKKLAHTYGGRRFGFPYIGMGLAGGNKDIIIPLLEDFADKVYAKGGSVTLVKYGD